MQITAGRGHSTRPAGSQCWGKPGVRNLTSRPAQSPPGGRSEAWWVGRRTDGECVGRHPRPRWTDWMNTPQGPRVMELYLEEAAELDQAKRKTIIQEAEQILLHEDNAYIGLYWYMGGHIVNNKIQNYNPVASSTTALRRRRADSRALRIEHNSGDGRNIRRGYRSRLGISRRRLWPDPRLDGIG